MPAINLSSGKNIDDFNVIIEISAQSGGVKYEFDKETGLLNVDRFMPTSMYYPCNYGFVPSTLAKDGDPVDVLVMTPEPVQAGSVLRCRGLGLLKMIDESGEDSKILAAPIAKICLHYDTMKTLSDIPRTLLDSIEHFFEHYKKLEPGKWVKIVGWEDKAAAEAELQAGIKANVSTDEGK